ncbi:iron-containing alcohol dehydrogenase [Oscillibacter sp.]|uniref:iron-containing alcohol dehydrogenase n=1 Tax=Oscillibacter sp. TaxID=1945593 RepID=UPI00261E4A74|nr:iron-containing alcohol dehydrogenase [Oscillibacter sp.]
MQGPGLINRLPKFAGNFGKTALLIIDPYFYDDFSTRVPKMFEEAGMKAYTVKFPGYAGHKELDELVAFVKTLPEVPETFIGMGGGQTMDLNKAVAATYRKNWISFATALTTDAPTFTHTVINNPGAQNELMFHYKNPDFVVVDTEITIQSPAWMLVSGIGDALATYIEAQASSANNNVCNSGLDDYRPTMLGMASAKLCYDILVKDGIAAMRAAKQHLRTPAYENVVEAATLLSGVGCENTGVSISHGLQAGFAVLPKHFPHGTGVGYCVLVQLLVQNDDRFEQIFEFNKAIGLPVCTADLEIPADQRDEILEALVDGVYGKRWNVTNVPFFFEKSSLLDAIKYLDAYAAEHQ